MRVNDLLPKEEAFWDYPINRKARDGFDEVLKKCNMVYSIYNNKIVVKTLHDEVVGLFLVVGANVEDKLLTIKVDEIGSVEDNEYIAVVLFDKDYVENIFLFKTKEVLLGKNRRLFKNFPEQSLIGIKIKKYKSRVMQKQKFGVILNNFIKLGEK